MALRLDDVAGVAGLEINISCPNVKAGGIAFGSDSESAHRVVKAVREKTRLPVMVKLSPNVTDVVAIAQSVEAAGADAVSLINTITGMAIDSRTRRPMLANITGGLSGPAIKPIALRMVWQVAGQVNIPVIGVGGIMNAEDAVEFLIAGARAVQVGTANFINPRATQDIVEGLEDYLQKNNINSIDDLIGSIRIGHDL